MNKHINNVKGLPASKYLFTSLLAIGILAMASGSANAQDVGMIKLTYFMLGHDGMVEQDVFIESPANSNQVSRIPVSQAAKHMDTVLYASMKAPPFEPMKAEPTETYPKGASLDITLGDWLKAKGTGSYACDGKQATIKASFQNLVPNAVYTMWNFIDLDPPTDPWQGLLVPAGTRDGSQSIFKTDAGGNATYELVIETCLQLSGTQSLAGLAIAWHNDGKTYGFSPGGLGVVAHAQLMAFFPRGKTKVNHQ